MSCRDVEQPEHSATPSSFALDKYEVTVGRFRAFVEAGGATQLNPPAADSGAHPLLGGSGWDSTWNVLLPAHQTMLLGEIDCPAEPTWTAAAGDNEQYPMNCLTWYQAFAFCIWDGGRLPTEAEWEYAAAGGDENRLYPWGNDAPESLPANYSSTDATPLIPVGSHQDGDGRWGHLDLAGSLREWTLDWYKVDYYTDTQGGCSDCAYLTDTALRTNRGGCWDQDAVDLRSASRNGSTPTVDHHWFGVRCARAAP